MPDVDLTTALGRLLSDAALRVAYRADPDALADRLAVDPAHRAAFLGLDIEAVDIQAEALLAKRFHEAADLVPETMARLGAAAWPLFRIHAEAFWPEGHRRHVEDAARFCGVVARREPRALCRAERNRMRFHSDRRRLAVGLVPRYPDGGRLGVALQVLVRGRGGAVREIALFALPRFARAATGRRRRRADA